MRYNLLRIALNSDRLGASRIRIRGNSDSFPKQHESDVAHKLILVFFLTILYLQFQRNVLAFSLVSDGSDPWWRTKAPACDAMSRASRLRSRGWDLGSCRTGYCLTSVPGGHVDYRDYCCADAEVRGDLSAFCCSVVPSVNTDPLYNPGICRACAASSWDAQCWRAILSRDGVD